MTASPATASGRSPSMVTMRVTLLVRPDLATAIGIARLDAAAGDGAGEAAEIQIGTVDPLHRQAERLVGQRGIDIHRFQMRRAAPGPCTRASRSLFAMTLTPKRADSGIAHLADEIQPRRQSRGNPTRCSSKTSCE